MSSSKNHTAKKQTHSWVVLLLVHLAVLLVLLFFTLPVKPIDRLKKPTIELNFPEYHPAQPTA